MTLGTGPEQIEGRRLVHQPWVLTAILHRRAAPGAAVCWSWKSLEQDTGTFSYTAECTIHDNVICDTRPEVVQADAVCAA